MKILRPGDLVRRAEPGDDRALRPQRPDICWRCEGRGVVWEHDDVFRAPYPVCFHLPIRSTYRTPAQQEDLRAAGLARQAGRQAELRAAALGKRGGA